MPRLAPVMSITLSGMVPPLARPTMAWPRGTMPPVVRQRPRPPYGREPSTLAASRATARRSVLTGARSSLPSNTGTAKRTNQIFATRAQLADADVDLPVWRLPPQGIVRRDHGGEAARGHEIAAIGAAFYRFGRATVLAAAALERVPIV